MQIQCQAVVPPPPQTPYCCNTFNKKILDPIQLLWVQKPQMDRILKFLGPAQYLHRGKELVNCFTAMTKFTMSLSQRLSYWMESPF